MCKIFNVFQKWNSKGTHVEYFILLQLIGDFRLGLVKIVCLKQFIFTMIHFFLR